MSVLSKSTPQVRVNRRRKTEQTILIFSLGFLAFLGLFPYIFMVLTSFKNNQQFVDSYWGLPVPIHFENYAAAWEQTKNGSEAIQGKLIKSNAYKAVFGSPNQFCANDSNPTACKAVFNKPRLG